MFQKDATVENLRGEKDHLSHEIQHLRQELQTVRANHDAIQNEVRALKTQLTERYMVTTNSPSIVAAVCNHLFLYHTVHIWFSFRMNRSNCSNNLHLHSLQSLLMFARNLLMTSVNQVKKARSNANMPM